MAARRRSPPSPPAAISADSSMRASCGSRAEDRVLATKQATPSTNSSPHGQCVPLTKRPAAARGQRRTLFGHTIVLFSDTRLFYNGHMNDLALLAPQVGVNERTLRRAFNEGTLRGSRLSPRRLKLATAEKEYVLDHWDLLAQLRQGLRTESNVRFALLFGSTARGDDSEESDVDLLVEMRDPSFGRRIELARKLEALLEKDVQVLTFGDAQSN